MHSSRVAESFMLLLLEDGNPQRLRVKVRLLMEELIDHEFKIPRCLRVEIQQRRGNIPLVDAVAVISFNNWRIPTSGQRRCIGDEMRNQLIDRGVCLTGHDVHPVH